MDNKKDAPEKSTDNPVNSPIKVFIEDDVSASVFARENTVRGEKRLFYSYTLSRSYRDAKGVYQYTKSYNPGDEPKAIKVIHDAEDYIRGVMSSEA